MLTITETEDAIRRIDTDPDVILGACKKIANSQEYTTEISQEALTREIIEAYYTRMEPSKLIPVLISATAVITAMSTKDGGEEAVIEGTVDLFRRIVRSTFTITRLTKELAGSEPDALADLLSMLKGLRT